MPKGSLKLQAHGEDAEAAGAEGKGFGKVKGPFWPQPLSTLAMASDVHTVNAALTAATTLFGRCNMPGF